MANLQAMCSNLNVFLSENGHRFQIQEILSYEENPQRLLTILLLLYVLVVFNIRHN